MIVQNEDGIVIYAIIGLYKRVFTIYNTSV